VTWGTWPASLHKRFAAMLFAYQFSNVCVINLDQGISQELYECMDEGIEQRIVYDMCQGVCRGNLLSIGGIVLDIPLTSGPRVS